MDRNAALIVRKIPYYYDLIMPDAAGAELYVDYRPYAGKEVFLGKAAGTEMVIPDPLPGQRAYFVLKYRDGREELSADRAVDIPGVGNCRDQGGYRTASGRSVKWGRFFRGAPLAAMDKAGMHPDASLEEAMRASVDGLGLKCVFDYRDASEAGACPDYVPAGARYAHVPAMRVGPRETSAAALDILQRMEAIRTEEDADVLFEHFRSIYDTLPFENPAYKALLDAMDHEWPLYQHCTAGKDRTGVGCALLLLSLGVDRDTVMGDYCLSAPFREEMNRLYIAASGTGNPNPLVKRLMTRMFTVERALLQSSFDAIDARYPDFEAFLYGEYGVTKERLAHWREIHLI